MRGVLDTVDDVEKMVFKVAEARQLSFDQKAGLSEGPYFVTSTTVAVFEKLREESRAGRQRLVFVYKDAEKQVGDLFLLTEYGFAHNFAWEFVSHHLRTQLIKAGVDHMKSCHVFFSGYGGVVEFNDRLEQVDVLILERDSLTQPFSTARNVVSIHVVHWNEPRDYMIQRLSNSTRTEDGANLAIGVFICGDVDVGYAAEIWFQRKGDHHPTRSYDVFEVAMVDIFETEEVRKVVRGKSFVLSCQELLNGVATATSKIGRMLKYKILSLVICYFTKPWD